MHWGINRPLKNITPLSFHAKPPLNLQTLRDPFLGNSSHLYWFFMNPPPPKYWIFQWTPEILMFFIVNHILYFKSTVTKFLVTISQFELLVMTEKYFCLSTFFLIKYFRFRFIFYIKIATTSLKKSPPLFPPPFLFENVVGGSTPAQTERGGGVVCTLWWWQQNHFEKIRKTVHEPY